MIRPDSWIKQQCRDLGLIHPYISTQVSEFQGKKIISYGVSSYGYDIRLDNKFKLFTNVHSSIIDPKNFNPLSFVDYQGDTCIIPPNSFVLGTSVEYFRIPRDTIAICLGKSTYARCGLIVNVTPLEPEWCGYLTIEISNTTPLPAIVYANEGIAQLIFLSSEKKCDISYADRQGKYQNQAGVTTAIV